MIQDFKTLYGAEATEQQKRYEELSAYFAEELRGANALSYFSAPGSTEVGGNHTDHQQRQACWPPAVNLDVIAAVTAKTRERRDPRCKSVGYADWTRSIRRTLTCRKRKRPAAPSSLHPRRVRTLYGARLCKLGGFDAVHDLERAFKGSGLSSSAAFEVLAGARCLTPPVSMTTRSTPRARRRRSSKYAENMYFGKPSGLTRPDGERASAAFIDDGLSRH